MSVKSPPPTHPHSTNTACEKLGIVLIYIVLCGINFTVLLYQDCCKSLTYFAIDSEESGPFGLVNGCDQIERDQIVHTDHIVCEDKGRQSSIT